MASPRPGEDHELVTVPFLHDVIDDTEGEPKTGLTPAYARRLYVSHALSTWNARLFEYAAVSLLVVRISKKLDEVSLDFLSYVCGLTMVSVSQG